MASQVSHPLVSVTMPVFNAERYLEPVLRAILRQTFRDFEVIAVDDGSTDRSLEILRRFQNEDRRVHVISQTNAGVVDARNACLRIAKGEFVAVNDADDVSLPNRFAVQVDYLKRHPMCVAVGSRMRFVDPEGFDLGKYFRLTRHEEIDAQHLHARGAAMGHSSVMMRADVVRSVGEYRQGFNPSEDFDLWLRLAEQGRLANLREVLVEYRVDPGSLSHTQSQRQQIAARRSANEARLRRGLPLLADVVANGAPQEVSFQRAWVRTAIGSGNLWPARKLAMRTWCRAPLSSASWRLLAVAILGKSAAAAARFSRRVLRSKPSTPNG